jgi:hypothetical protein
MKTLLAILLSLAPSVSFAGAQAEASKDLNAQAINTACASDVGNTDSPSCASFELYTANAKQVCLIFRYVYGTASAYQVYEDGSVDGAPPWGKLAIGTLAGSGKVSMAGEYAEWLTGSANDTEWPCYDVQAPWTRFRFTTTGGAATDKITVYHTLVY